MEVGGIETNVRRVGDAPVLYVHDIPNASWEWEPFLARTGGVAPDLPGFGESGKANNFDYTLAGYGRWLGQFADAVGLDRFSLVVHGWGAVGFELGDRIERLVVLGELPADREETRLVRMWRTPLVGELTMGFTSKRAFMKRYPERAWQDFDHGTQRAILKLHRSPGTLQAPAVPTLTLAAGLTEPDAVERVAHFLRA